MTAPSMAELIAENEQLRRENAVLLAMQAVIDAKAKKMAAGEGVRQWPRVAV